MKDIKFAIGKKIFSFKCDERDVAKLNALSSELNKLVNINIIKYRGLSEDNVFLLTAFELLDEQKADAKNTVIEREIVKEIIKEVSRPEVPKLYHPYPRIDGGFLSMDLFGQDINQDAKTIDSLLEKQDEIDQNISEISAYLNKMIIALSLSNK